MSLVKMEALDSLTRSWFHKHDLVDAKESRAQYKKMREEVGELTSGIVKSQKEVVIDSIGDGMVVMIGISERLGLTINWKAILSIEKSINESHFKHIKLDSWEYLDNELSYFATTLYEYEEAVLSLEHGGKNWDGTHLPVDIALAEVSTSIHNVLIKLQEVAREQELTLVECLEFAYNEIKDRKVKKVNGVLVKEEDQK